MCQNSSLSVCVLPCILSKSSVFLSLCGHRSPVLCCTHSFISFTCFHLASPPPPPTHTHHMWTSFLSCVPAVPHCYLVIPHCLYYLSPSVSVCLCEFVIPFLCLYRVYLFIPSPGICKSVLVDFLIFFTLL